MSFVVCCDLSLFVVFCTFGCRCVLFALVCYLWLVDCTLLLFVLCCMLCVCCYCLLVLVLVDCCLLFGVWFIDSRLFVVLLLVDWCLVACDSCSVVVVRCVMFVSCAL